MIVKMSKLSVLVYHKEKESFLKALQELGIVDIAENPDIDSPEAVSESYRQAVKISRACERVIRVLAGIKADRSLDIPQEQARDVTWEKIDTILFEFEKLEREKERLSQELSETRKEIRLLTPWGDFDPNIVAGLAAKRVKLRFFETTMKKFGSLDFGDFYHAVVSSEKNQTRFVVFEKEGIFETDAAEEAAPPMKSLSRLKDDEIRLESEIDRLEREFAGMTAYLDTLNHFKTQNDNVANFVEANVTMARTVGGRVYSMTGWFPAEREKIITRFLDNYTCYYQIQSPDPDDNVPILLRNNRFARLFEPITKIYSLPSYWELDPTPFFAPFFALYFGLCLGDLGYGAMILIMAIAAFMFGPNKFRSFYVIGLMLGGLTMACGIALNSFFGQPIFYLQGNSEYFIKFDGGGALSFLGSFVNRNSITKFPAMGFAIAVGVLQVLLGLLLQTVNRARRHGYLWGVHPASFFLVICGVLFSIGHGGGDSGFKGVTGIDISTYQLGTLQIGKWLNLPGQEFGVFLILAGLALMFLFNNPDKRMLFRPLFGLWELYGFATGIVGDILSYLRLFALGLASGLLGHAFNGIAVKFIDGGIFPGIFATVALLLFAHTLNFGLAVLGSFVHPLRLTFVEFYKNLDFEGGGKSYSPFAIKKNEKD